ncbi:tRNA (N(6)-L-threonylcarbamoyladenosine(37)-C(2))-methylthiotransferase [Patescibacteria group bacterium]|nr:tRNA (N(6)-L-threonylcarbamoyladenosine(37)-C(2))-methylthiotransferase [Patescibacteria group bacterium]
MEIYFETYGCTANYNSTEIMKGLVRQVGFNITSNVNYADLIIINSCIVKEPTEEKIRRRIQDLLREKKKIILAGCMPRINKSKLSHKNLFLLDTSQIKNLINLIQDVFSKTYEPEKYLRHRKEIKLTLPKIPKEKFIGITQISEGCLGDCSYCITKLAKGKLFSYPKEKILESIKSDLDSGAKEIWLTSQDCASYGNDEGKYLLPELLREIIKIKKNFYLRVGMSNPNNLLKILSDLIKIYKDKKIFKFLHIPVQSGSNKILRLMNRNYTSEDFLKIIKEFRKKFPQIHISTDVIVGFPEETEKDFQQTYDLIKEIKPETINVSKFWPRPETSAEKMKSQVDADTKKQRAIKLLCLHKEICDEIQKKFLGTIHKVLLDQKGFENTYLARDENYKLFAILSREKILGKKLMVKVKKLTPHYLIGSVI